MFTISHWANMEEDLNSSLDTKTISNGETIDKKLRNCHFMFYNQYSRSDLTIKVLETGKT